MTHRPHARPRFAAVGRHCSLATAAVIGAAALLVASCSGAGSASTSPAAPGANAATSPPPAVADPTPSMPANAIVVHVRDFALDPTIIRASGAAVALNVINDGPTVHNVTVRDASGHVVFATRDLRAGEQQVVVASLPPPGRYTTFCSLPGHESLGIKGSLVIR